MITIRTTVYDEQKSYWDVYISNDSVALQKRKSLLLNHEDFFDVDDDRRKFLYVDEKTFKLIKKFIFKRDEKIHDFDFPKPFYEIYYVRYINGKKRIPTTGFGEDKEKAKKYFNSLKEYLIKKACSKILIEEIDFLIKTLE